MGIFSADEKEWIRDINQLTLREILEEAINRAEFCDERRYIEYHQTLAANHNTLKTLCQEVGTMKHIMEGYIRDGKNMSPEMKRSYFRQLQKN